MCLGAKSGEMCRIHYRGIQSSAYDTSVCVYAWSAVNGLEHFVARLRVLTRYPSVLRAGAFCPTSSLKIAATGIWPARCSFSSFRESFRCRSAVNSMCLCQSLRCNLHQTIETRRRCRCTCLTTAHRHPWDATCIRFQE